MLPADIIFHPVAAQETMTTTITEGPRVEGENWSIPQLKGHFETVIEEKDRRYNEHFKSLQEAFQVGLLAQEKSVALALTAAEKAVQAAMEAAKEAVTKAEIANDKRMDAANEIRGALGDQAVRFILRTEAVAMIDMVRERSEAAVKLVNEKVALNSARLERAEGKGLGSQQSWGYLIAAVTVIVTVIGVFLRYAGGGH